MAGGWEGVAGQWRGREVGGSEGHFQEDGLDLAVAVRMCGAKEGKGRRASCFRLGEKPVEEQIEGKAMIFGGMLRVRVEGPLGGDP